MVDTTVHVAEMDNANGRETHTSTVCRYTVKVVMIVQTIKIETYQRLEGNLRYLADCTRPDLTFTVGMLGAGNHAPTVRHWNMLKETVRFFHGTRQFGIIYIKKSSVTETVIEIFSDADFCGETMDRKSITGDLITYKNKPVEWQSVKQSKVSMSTAKAE